MKSAENGDTPSEEIKSKSAALVLTVCDEPIHQALGIIKRIRQIVPNIYLIIVSHQAKSISAKDDREWNTFVKFMKNNADEIVFLDGNLRYTASAINTGFRIALQKGFGIIGTMKADGKHLPELLPTLMNTIRRRNVQVASASRCEPDSKVQVNMPFERLQVFVETATLFEEMFKKRVTDPFSSYRLFRREVAEELLSHMDDFVEIEKKYFSPVVSYWIAMRNLNMVEIPHPLTPCSSKKLVPAKIVFEEIKEALEGFLPKALHAAQAAAAAH